MASERLMNRIRRVLKADLSKLCGANGHSFRVMIEKTGFKDHFEILVLSDYFERGDFMTNGKKVLNILPPAVCRRRGHVS